MSKDPTNQSTTPDHDSSLNNSSRLYDPQSIPSRKTIDTPAAKLHNGSQYADEQRSLVDAPNKVPQHQRFYQQAYRQHIRVWQINPRSNMLLVPYQILLWGTLGASMYMMGRKVFGYNTWFGKA
ncbi:hypothetical protein F5Y12DRAFT_715982 [Xylaria sp. FL1777]|nr:hypothetical protein F5Y12DRAFT_715982 [Xylaria sp. FL1777]